MPGPGPTPAAELGLVPQLVEVVQDVGCESPLCRAEAVELPDRDEDAVDAPGAARVAGIQARSLARCRRGDGSVVTVDIIAAPLRHGGQPVGAIAFLDQVYPVPSAGR